MTLELTQDQYVIRRKFFRLVGNEFRVFDPAGEQVLFSKQKAFKLREDIRIWSGDDMQTELLRIAARQIVDFSAAYDVIDSATNTKVGALKRKGLKSIVRDHWILMDPNDREIGFMEEDSVGMALLRRFINWIPQKFHIAIGQQHAANLRQNWNPFVLRLTLDFSPDTQRLLDRRLGLAVGILHSAIEGKQN